MIFLVLINADKKQTISYHLKFIISLALAPFLVTLLLHYLLYLFPDKNAIVYIGIVLGIFMFTGILNLKNISSLFQYYKNLFFQFKEIDSDKTIYFKNNFFTLSSSDKQKINFHKILLFLVLLITVLFWGVSTLTKEFTGHDMLEYAIQAKHFTLEKKIDYVENRYHAENNFVYVGLHGFSFPLLGTWEFLFSDFFGIKYSDYFFRSISGYYAIILMISIFITMYSLKKNLAWIIALFLFSTYGFFLMLTSYHIDTFRITFIILSFIMLWHLLKSEQNFNIVILGLLCGAMSYIHSLGVFITVFICISYFLFSQKSIKARLMSAFLLTLMILFAGGFHYILDVLLGTGWIFQEIKYY